MSSAFRKRSSRSWLKRASLPRTKSDISGGAMPSASAARGCVHPLSVTIVRIRRASSAFANRAAASGSPRSSKTFPLLGSISRWARRFLPSLWPPSSHSGRVVVFVISLLHSNRARTRSLSIRGVPIPDFDFLGLALLLTPVKSQLRQIRLDSLTGDVDGGVGEWGPFLTFARGRHVPFAISPPTGANERVLTPLDQKSPQPGHSAFTLHSLARTSAAKLTSEGRAGRFPMAANGSSVPDRTSSGSRRTPQLPLGGPTGTNA